MQAGGGQTRLKGPPPRTPAGVFGPQYGAFAKRDHGEMWVCISFAAAMNLHSTMNAKREENVRNVNSSKESRCVFFNFTTEFGFYESLVK